MRPNLSASPAAKARAIRVLAVPGTPSSRMWPLTRRLVSIRSRMSSCPTTALRTSPRSASVTSQMSSTSIEDRLSPLVNVARQPFQHRRVARLIEFSTHSAVLNPAAVDAYSARERHLLQPADELQAGKPLRRMQLAGGIADGLIDIAAQD